MSDGFVRPPADNTGKAVDADVNTNTDGLQVYRIRVAVPGGMTVSGDILDLLCLEMRATNDLLAQAFGLDKDLESMRKSGDA